MQPESLARRTPLRALPVFDVDGPYGEANYQPAANTYAISQTEYDPFGLRRILEILADADVLATFCWVGKEAQDRPERPPAAAQGMKSPCTPGITATITTMTAAEQREDMLRTSDALFAITGERPVRAQNGRLALHGRHPRHLPGDRTALGDGYPRGDLPFLTQPDAARSARATAPFLALGRLLFFVDKMMTPKQTFEFWRDDLDVIRAEGSLMSPYHASVRLG